MKKRVFIIVAVVVVLAVSWGGISTSRAGYESAEYESVEKDGKFEVRIYPALTTASTSVSEDRNERKQRNSSFGRLFKFITGDNESGQKIAMTTPVFMTANDNAEVKTMHFVVPKAVTKKGVPAPSGKAVSLSKVNGGKYAVLRFSGSGSKEKQKEAVTELRELLKQRGLKSTGAPMFAFYDPPWTPEMFRRNEVLLKLQP